MTSLATISPFDFRGYRVMVAGDSKGIGRGMAPALYQNTLAKIPFGRFARPEEIAHAALFLASPWASWITGQTLCADGGQLLSG